MRFNRIIKRFAEGLGYIDQSHSSAKSKQRTSGTYLSGLPPLTETECVSALVDWWPRAYPTDFVNDLVVESEVPYPNRRRAKCDIVIASSTENTWAIEVKRIQFVGDNGKNNDFALSKTLSPYGKDRSLLHDASRLTSEFDARSHAVVAYGFEYDFQSCDEAELLHPTERERIRNIRDVCRKNNEETGDYHVQPLIEMINSFLSSRYDILEYCDHPFSGLWAHPCGGKGRVFGWHLANPT